MKKLFLIMMALTAVLILSSCKSIDMSTNQVGWSNYSSLATKDFDVVGIVYLESTETIKKSPLNLSTTIKGSRITYSDLMKKAEELGADDIINVRVDRNTDSTTTIIDFLIGSTRTYKYKATATAIKYTNAASDGSTAGNSGNLVKPEETGLMSVFSKEEY